MVKNKKSVLCDTYLLYIVNAAAEIEIQSLNAVLLFAHAERDRGLKGEREREKKSKWWRQTERVAARGGGEET